jgi:hypothetical protein
MPNLKGDAESFVLPIALDDEDPTCMPIEVDNLKPASIELEGITTGLSLTCAFWTKDGCKGKIYSVGQEIWVTEKEFEGFEGVKSGACMALTAQDHKDL